MPHLASNLVSHLFFGLLYLLYSHACCSVTDSCLQRKPTPAQKECAEHKRIANDYHQRMHLGDVLAAGVYVFVCAKPSDEAAGSDVLGYVRIKEHWAFVKRRDEIRELHIWQGQHDCKAG